MTPAGHFACVAASEAERDCRPHAASLSIRSDACRVIVFISNRSNADGDFSGDALASCIKGGPHRNLRGFAGGIGGLRTTKLDGYA